jgi:hypothetical protein
MEGDAAEYSNNLDRAIVYQKRWLGGFPVAMQLTAAFFALQMGFLIDTNTVIAVPPLLLSVLAWAVVVQGTPPSFLPLELLDDGCLFKG